MPLSTPSIPGSNSLGSVLYSLWVTGQQAKFRGNIKNAKYEDRCLLRWDTLQFGNYKRFWGPWCLPPSANDGTYLEITRRHIPDDIFSSRSLPETLKFPKIKLYFVYPIMNF